MASELQAIAGSLKTDLKNLKVKAKSRFGENKFVENKIAQLKDSIDAFDDEVEVGTKTV